MTQEALVDLVRNAVLALITISAPPLIMGLTVGVLVSIFQTVTSIQEQTLAFVPKILAVFLSLLIFGPFMLNTALQYITNLYQHLPDLMTPR